jgi:hypothetical protein
MKSLFEDSYSRIWHDGASPIIFVSFTQILDDKTFVLPGKITTEFVKKLLRHNKNAYALIDLSEFTCPCPKVSEHFYSWVLKLHECGIESTAIVTPKKGKLSTEKLSAQEDSHVSLFSCFEKALRNINTQMTMRLLST